MVNNNGQRNDYKAEKVALVYCLFGLLWILTSDALVATLVKDTDLLVSMGTFKGVLFVATTTALLYLTLKVWQHSPSDSSSQSHATESRREILLVFSGLALLVPLLVAAVAQVYIPMVIKEAQSDAEMIAQNRAVRVDAWLQERESEALRLHHDQALIQWLDGMVEGVPEHQTALHSIEMMHQYAGFESVLLLNNRFEFKIGVGERSAGLTPELPVYGKSGYGLSDHELSDPGVREQLRELLSEQVWRSNMYTVEGRQYIDWLVPVLADDGGVRGYVLLSSDLERLLYPLLNDWSVSRYTAELRLVEKVEQRLRLLTSNSSRQESFQTELDYQFLNGNPLLPEAGVGVFSGAVMGPDGVSLLLAMAPLSNASVTNAELTSTPITSTPLTNTPLTNALQSNAPWYLLVTIDKRSVMARVYSLLAWVSLLAIAAVAAIAVSLALVWQKSRRVQQLALAQQAAEKDKLLFKFFELPFVGMSITEPASGLWIRFNEKFCDILGYSPEELKTLSWYDITHKDDLPLSQKQFQ